MKNLVQRYVIARQKSGNENNAVTEDDINEVKQEVLTFRSDLIQILRESGMKAKRLNECSAGIQHFKIIFMFIKLRVRIIILIKHRCICVRYRLGARIIILK